MGTPPDRPKQHRKSKQRSTRTNDGFELEDGGPPHPELADGVARSIVNGELEDGGPPQAGSDIDGIPPAPIKLSIGKWFRFHGPAAAMVPVAALVGIVFTALCFLNASTTAGVVVALLSVITTICLVALEAYRHEQRRRHRHRRHEQ